MRACSGRLPAAKADALASVAYLPSALELAWRSRIDSLLKVGTCEALGEPANRAVVQRVIDILQAQMRFGAGAQAEVERLIDIADAHGDLSRMQYTLASGRVITVRLEPLIGFMRDPRTSCPPKVATKLAFTPQLADSQKQQLSLLQTHPWVVLDSARTRELHSAQRALMADMGASTWSHAAGARWIVLRNEQAGIHMEHIWTWEATPKHGEEYFAEASAEQRARIHFYNFPVNDVEGHVNNPWTLIRASARVDDYVSVKLDIDAAAIETELVRQLNDDARLHGLVDEFFYEHHVDCADLNWMGWAGYGFPHNVSYSIELFTSLRKLGVRAHMWP